MKNRNFILAAFPFIAALLLSAGCKKDKPTWATVIVKNGQGQVVPGAKVILEGNGTGNSMNAERFHIELVTDGTGKAFYDFSDYYKQGQAGFAVLDISVQKGSQYGEGLIKVDEEEKNEELVVIE